MCCTRLAGNTGRKITQKIAICAPSHNFVELFLCNECMYRQPKRNLLNSNISPTCSHNIVNFGPLTAEICSGVRAPQRISTGFASWFCYYSDVAHRTPTWAGTLYIHFGGSCPLTEFCYVQNSLAFSYIVSVTARHSSSGRQPNFAAWYKEWNYGTFAEGATYSWLGSHHIGHRPIF